MRLRPDPSPTASAPCGAVQQVMGMIGRIWRGEKFVQRVDDEAAVAQDLDPLAVAEVELYPSL